MVTRKQIENLYKVYYAATEEFRRIGFPGRSEVIHENFMHEVAAWDAWYDNGEDPHERPDEYRPTMSDLNYWLGKFGYKGIGGKNPRVVKL